MALNTLPKQFLSGLGLSNEPPKDLPTKEECQYTKYFCEENIWLLAKTIKEKTPQKLKFCYPIFISNEGAHIPLWHQSASNQEDGLVVWDYHVIMVYSDEVECWVYDFDTDLPFPSNFNKYCEETFKPDDFPESQMKSSFHRFFRVLPANLYLKHFSSDRRHMQDEDGEWRKSPPSYPPIRSSDEIHNLDKYISMKEGSEESYVKFGQVFNLNSFILKFSLKKTSDIDYLFPPEPTCL